MTTSSCQSNNITTCLNLEKKTSCVEYIYDETRDDAFKSLAAEYHWVCEKAKYGSDVLVAQSIGIILSNIVFMQLSDTWGRVPTFHMTNFLFIVMRVISMHITEHYWPFLIVFAAGSTFSPLGIRIGYTLGIYIDIFLILFKRICLLQVLTKKFF